MDLIQRFQILPEHCVPVFCFNVILMVLHGSSVYVVKPEMIFI